jgi:DNA polymerase-3 subunit gamma/tau
VAPAKPATAPTDSAGYTVVARRYRPQRFEDVVGQDHVVQALRNAIRLNRVTHAYLFCGTRGVGKTSIARIFAKCLNCVKGPTEEPDLTCDVCEAIAVGQDVDVIEIDGASNNGVEAVRELRQNASLRPSRSRYKIYYIDEVHMLSTGAFNALLKTLEEPPEHVKFFFATTEPNKIPITVLSRCQRYDFAGITPEQIVETLAGICAQEHVEAEPEALRTVARRAGGSMRDAQSLLEQLLSAGDGRLTVEGVHRLLGTASDERLLDIIAALADHDLATTLRLNERAANEGVQPADLLNGLLDLLRDLMVLAAGAEVSLLTVSPRQRPRLQSLIERWPLESILAALQILDQARAGLRGSTNGRLKVEVALARVALLENLSNLSDVITRLAALESDATTPAASSSRTDLKKKLEPRSPSPTAPTSPETSPPPSAQETEPPVSQPLPTLEAVVQAWPDVIKKVGAGLGVGLSQVAPTAILGPNLLVIGLSSRYNWVAEKCDTVEARAKLEHVLLKVLNRRLTVRFDRGSEEPASTQASVSVPSPRREGVDGDTLVQKVVELFEARPFSLEFEEDTPPSSRS